MTGFCEDCGEPVARCLCPHRRTKKLDLKPVAKTMEKPVELPKAKMHRRLLGSGIEFGAYVAGAWLIAVVDFFSSGLMGLFCLVLFGLIVLRDCNAGLFSIAKRIGSQRVVHAKTGMPASNTQALLRNSYYLGLLLIAILPFVDLATSPTFTLLVFVDMVMIIANPKGRRLGDFLASTQVVDARG
jgi:uncharacterized RDD family membrane protein YckC